MISICTLYMYSGAGSTGNSTHHLLSYVVSFLSIPQLKPGMGKVAIRDDSSMAESTGGNANLLDSQSPKVGQTATTKHQGLITVKVGAIFLYSYIIGVIIELVL